MKSRLLEIIGILSLSFIICSTMAVSSGIPEMMETFPNHSRASLEFLMSAPTIAILTIITLTPFLTRFVKENTLICLGLFLIGTTGVLPFFFQSYPIMLCSRIGLGMGIGFINPHAVTLIGEHSGRMSFYGQGAGRYPTAYNVVQDCADVLSGKGFYAPYGAKVKAVNNGKLRYYVRGASDHWLESVKAEAWGSATVTCPISVSELHSWLAAHPGTFAAAISE